MLVEILNNFEITHHIKHHNFIEIAQRILHCTSTIFEMTQRHKSYQFILNYTSYLNLFIKIQLTTHIFEKCCILQIISLPKFNVMPISDITHANNALTLNQF